MAQCTAPVRGHNSTAAAAACPACRYRGSYRYGGNGGGYGSSYSSSGRNEGGYSSSSGGGGGGRSSGSSRPRWSRAGSSVPYTPSQVQSLTPIRQTVETRAVKQPDLRDVFLCHAWDDRQGPAKELHDLLVVAGVKVWVSEIALALGVPMMRAIDKRLANWASAGDPCAAGPPPQKRASPIKSFRYSWRVISSYPSNTRRRMKLSAMSTPCSPPEVAWTLQKIQWRWSRQKSPSWSPSRSRTY